MAKNKYDSACRLCPYLIPRNMGRRVKVGTEWLTEHIECPDPVEVERIREINRQNELHNMKIQEELRNDPKAQAWARSRGIRL